MLFPQPRRVRIKTASDRQRDFSHACAGQDTPFLSDERSLREHLHEVSFTNDSRKSGFSRWKLNYSRTFRSTAA